MFKFRHFKHFLFYNPKKIPSIPISDALIDYTWNTQVNSGNMELVNSGTSGVTNDAPMFSGEGVKFDGVGNEIQTTINTQETGSLFCTFQGVAPNSAGELIFGAWQPNRCYISINPNGLISFGIAEQNWSTTDQSYETLVVDKIYKLCLTWDGTTATLYDNGVQVAQNTYSGSTADPLLFSISGYESSQIVKDAYCFSDILTSQEIDKYNTDPNDFFIDATNDSNCVLNGPLDGTGAITHEYVTNTDLTIQGTTTNCRNTTSALSYGTQSFNFTKDANGWRTGLSQYIELDNASGHADTSWTPSGTWQIEEVDMVGTTETHRVYSSDGTKYTNGVSDGTYTVPTTEIILNNTNIENIAIDEYKIFRVYPTINDEATLYNNYYSGGTPAPVFSSSSTNSVQENQTSAITLQASNTTSYSISGTDSALFNVNSSSGVVTFKTAPSYASPSDANADNVYAFTAAAAGAGGSTNQSVAITVTQQPTTQTIQLDGTMTGEQ